MDDLVRYTVDYDQVDQVDQCRRLLNIREIFPNIVLSRILSEISFPLSSTQELVIRLLLKHKLFYINSQVVMAPIHQVAMYWGPISEREKRIIKLIINHPEVDLNLRCSTTYDWRALKTPLMIAAREGNLVVVRELLKHRDTDVKAKAHRGYGAVTAYDFALSQLILTGKRRCECCKDEDGNAEYCDYCRYLKVLVLLTRNMNNREKALEEKEIQTRGLGSSKH